MRLRATVVTLLAAWLVVCAGGRTPVPRASEPERRAYAQALSSTVDDPEAAERALQEFLTAYPQSPLADDAAMRLGEIDLTRGDVASALQRYYWVDRNYPDSDRADAARVEIARLELARGNEPAASAIMERTTISKLSNAERRVAYQVLADVATDPVEKLRWLSRVRAAETDEDRVAMLDVEIDELIAPLDRADLLRAGEQIGSEIPAARVLLKAANLALDKGDVEAARDAVERASRLDLAPPYQMRRTTVSERLRLSEEAPEEDIELPTFAEAAARATISTAGAEGTIGVVLPLTGPFARFAEESLQGVLLAAGVFGSSAGEALRVRVLIRDSGGRPEQADRAVRELADQDVVAIIGPLLRGECEAAAAAAEERGVPLLALTARPEISALRPHVFRLRTMPSEEVDTLVKHAVRQLGAQRFAILYPRDSYGRGQRRLFWHAVEKQGGRIVGVASYDPQATDFSKAIRRLVGYEMLTEVEKEALEDRDDMESQARRLPAEEAVVVRAFAAELTGPDGELLPPIVDFDALFIPESHEKVALIAPQLAFHRAVGTTLLGPSGWNHPDLLKIARKHVEGARFTAQFLPVSGPPIVRDFTGRFDRAYAAPPNVFAAQAFDAANLILMQLARGRDSRAAVRKGILSVTGYPGVTGVMTMRKDGSAKKRPFLLAIVHGRIESVD